MATALNKLRNILTATRQSTGNGSLEPELGFKVTLNANTQDLKVTVIGARHLPTIFGLTPAESYSVKVKLFPGKEKYETKLQKESWPIFNQDFTFSLSTKSKKIDEQLMGKFIVLTVCAILENDTSLDECSSPMSPRLLRKSFRNFFSMDSDLRRTDSTRSNAFKFKRRTVGAVTYNLDPRGFTQQLRNNYLGTPDIWRPVTTITSGLVKKQTLNENKGSLELTMQYSVSENGKNDMISLTLSRIRFTIQTMESHENYTGSLYVKMKIFEHDVVVAKWKSNKFEPTISLKLESTTANLLGTVQTCNLYAVRCEVRLMCKNKLGKKTDLGYVVIKPKDGHWEQALETPSTSVTLWHNFK